MSKHPRIDREVARLPKATRDLVRTEIAQAEVEGEPKTPPRDFEPGERKLRGYNSWKCSGKSWPVDQIKGGAIQQCPREDLDTIRYNLDHDMVERYCVRCGHHIRQNPNDRYFSQLNVPAEIPKLGWRPDPMTRGWKK